MRTIQTRFGVEKLCFLISAMVASCVSYHFMVSEPARLNPSTPVSSTLASPAALPSVPLAERSDEETYVYSGANAQTGTRVNRDRRNPFAPYPRENVIPGIEEKVIVATNPSNSVVKVEPKRSGREFAPAALESAVTYRGVVSANGATFGLLQNRDGYLRVLEGSEFSIADVSYRVTSLEKQAICLKHGDVAIRLKSK